MPLEVDAEVLARLGIAQDGDRDGNFAERLAEPLDHVRGGLESGCTIGSAELIGTWVDPDFNPARPALYYVRVLEIPTPRWTTFDAVRNKLALLEDVPATIQERAWTSPIWYTPEP
jgi:hypothetical protein